MVKTIILLLSLSLKLFAQEPITYKYQIKIDSISSYEIDNFSKNIIASDMFGFSYYCSDGRFFFTECKYDLTNIEMCEIFEMPIECTRLHFKIINENYCNRGTIIKTK